MRVDWARFCEDFDVALVVPSRNRAEMLAKRTDRFAHGYHLFHAGPGYDRHQYHCVERHEVPLGVGGMATVRNHVLRTLDQNIVVFLDDDVSKVRYTHSTHYVDLDPAMFHLMLVNLVVNTLDVGARVFGISELDIRKTTPLAPLRFRAVVSSLIGVVGRDRWFDERNQLKVDYDYCLSAMRDDRVLLKDDRYFLAQDRNRAAGGNMEFRTREREAAEVANLVRWWGPDVIQSKRLRQTMGLSVRVP